MEITEVRRRFDEYASGQLTGPQLRDVIRSALADEPILSTAYAALAEAYRRANVIDSELQSSILSDISQLTGPKTGGDGFGQPYALQDGTAPFSRGPDGVSSERDWAAAEDRSSDDLMSWVKPQEEPASNAAQPFADEASTPGSLPESVSAVESATTSGTGSTMTVVSGTTSGSNWDSPAWLTEPATPLHCGSVLNARYELLEELGRGGMGVVYKALDRRAVELNDQQCYVAVKVLNDDFKRHPLAVRSLQREARKAQKLAHPNILTVYCFDRDGGNAYMVMELLSGTSLDRLIRSEGKTGLPLTRVRPIVRSLGAALTYAHEQGFIHSDFKPSNAFVTAEGVVKVLDFGIARAVPWRAVSDHTIFDASQLGAICPAYATIEMMNGESPDVRDDVYALAAVIYELVAGHHPFNRIDALKARDAGLRPHAVRGLSRAQWQALKKGLAFERDERIASIEDLIAPFVRAKSSRTAWTIAAAGIVGLAIAAGFAAQWSAVRPGALVQRGAMQLSSIVDSLRIKRAEHRLDALDPAAPQYLDELIKDHNDVTILASLAPGSDILPRIRTDAARVLERRVRDRLAANDAAAASELVDRFEGMLPAPLLTDLRQMIARSESVALAAPPARQAPPIARAAAPEAPAAPEVEAPAPVAAVSTETTGASGGNAANAAKESAPTDALSDLTGRPEPSETWATALQAQLRSLARALPPDDARLAAARHIAVTTFVTAAASAREARQYTEATDLLNTARSFDPNAREIKREATAIEHEESAGLQQAPSATPATPRVKPVDIEPLKSKLVAQIAAGDMNAANATAVELHRLAPTNTFVVRELPPLLVGGYLQLAKREMASGNVDSALQTLAAGRRRYGRDPQLKDLEARYVRIGDEYDRLRTAVVLNPDDHRSALAQLRSAEGADYPVAAQMLAQTLANRIADQRAAKHSTVASSLLQAGRAIFPDHLELLDHGKAGALPTAIDIGTEMAPIPAMAEGTTAEGGASR